MATLQAPRSLGTADSTPDLAAHPAFAEIAAALARMRYGAIQLIVHDGRLVQLEVTERQRFT